jgi:hypothetical protein
MTGVAARSAQGPDSACGAPATSAGRPPGHWTAVWDIGLTPQPFHITIVELTRRFKDELWEGCLFGPEHRRDQVLSALLANAGLDEAVRLTPKPLWERALEEAG